MTQGDDTTAGPPTPPGFSLVRVYEPDLARCAKLIIALLELPAAEPAPPPAAPADPEARTTE
jgi:hypothetical protein